MTGKAIYSIRPLTEQDLSALESRAATEPDFWTADQLRAEIAHPQNWNFAALRRPDHQLLGYICGRLLQEEAEIFHLATAAACRRQGVATSLLSHALARLHQAGVKRCFLEVRAASHGAEELYLRQGFNRLSCRKNYYSDPIDDAIIMRKTF